MTDLRPTRVVATSAAIALAFLAAMTPGASAAPPANDAFASAQVLSGTDASTTGTTLDATTEAGEPKHAQAWDPGGSVWFRWEAPKDGLAVVKAGTHVLAVYTGESVDALTDVASYNPYYETESRVRFKATAGTTYRIAVARSYGYSQFVSLELDEHDLPANDSFANAEELTGSSAAATANTAGATRETTGPYLGGGADVWYEWTAPSTGAAVIDTAGSSYDTRLAAYTGDSLDALVAVATNDDDYLGENGSSRVAFRAVAGTTYRIVVDDDALSSPAGGDLKLALRIGPAPANDAFADAVDLGGAAIAAASGSNEGASTETGEPPASTYDYCYVGTPGSTVWYRWKAPRRGSLVIRAAARFQSRLAAYTGPTVSELTRVVNQPQAYNGGSEQIRIRVEAGVTYRIAVDASCGQPGAAFDLSLTLTNSPANDDLANAAPLTGTSVDLDATNVGATQEECEPTHDDNYYDPSVWYTWTAPASGGVTLELSGALNGVMGIYTGATTCALVRVPSARLGEGRERRFQAVAGTKYRIAVDGVGAQQAAFHLSLRASTPPANDNFGSAANLGSSLTASVAGNNGGSGSEAWEPNHYSYCRANGFQRTVWYRWTAPKRGSLTLKSTAPFQTVLAAYVGDTVSGLTRVPNQPQGYDGGTEQIRIRVTAGVTYRFAVASHCTGADGAFTLGLTLSDPPANDDFANPRQLTGTTVAVDGTNVHATQEPCEPTHDDNYYDPSVWYSWTAPSNGSVTLKVSGELTGVIGVYTGAELCTLTRVESERLSAGLERRFRAVAGTTYRIAVDGARGVQAPFRLELVETLAPANDALGSAVDLGSGATASVDGTNRGASMQAGEPDHYPFGPTSCYRPMVGSSVWYSWTAPRSGTLAVKATPKTPFEVMIGVYTGSDPSALARPHFGSYGGSSVTGNRLRVVAGTTYRIAVDSQCWRFVEGDFTLSLELTDAPANDHLADAVELTGATPEADGSTAGATHEKGEPWHGASHDGSVWYGWTAESTGGATVDLSGVEAAHLAVYTGDSVDKLTRLRSTESGKPTTRHFATTAGTKYWIAVDADEGAAPFHLTLATVARPANDDFAAAEVLTGAHATTSGDNIGATAEAGEPTWPDGSADGTVWYAWTAPDDGRVTVDLGRTFNGIEDGSLIGGAFVYTGDSVGSLTKVAGEHWRYSFPISFRAAKGTTYRIRVQGYRSFDRGPFKLALDLTPPPPNDDFANAVELTGQSASASGTTAGGTLEPGESTRCYASAEATTWFRWTAPANGRVYLDTAGSAVTTKLGVHTGSRVDDLKAVKCSSSGGGVENNSKVDFVATAGETYSIAVNGWMPADVGAIKLALEQHPTPPNDDFANATRLTGTVASASGTTVGAGKEANESCCTTGVGGTASIWYRWRAPADGQVTVDTAGSDFDTSLGVLEGWSSLDYTQRIAWSDDFDGTPQSQVQFFARAGQEYLLVVDGNLMKPPPHRGNVTLHLRQGPPPANDDLANAQTVTGSTVDVTGTNAGATSEAGEPEHAGRAGGTSVWYRWTAVRDGAATISTAGSGFDTLLGVYRGDSVGSLTQVAANDEGPAGRTSAVELDAEAGATYLIAVDGVATADGPVGGTVKLSIAGTRPPTPPVTPPPAPAPLDLTAAFPGRKLGPVLANGLTGTARCSRACTLTAKMLVGPNGARRLGLATLQAEVATATAAAKGNTPTNLVLKLRKATVAKLAGMRKLGITVRVTARSGTATKAVMRRFTLQR